MCVHICSAQSATSERFFKAHLERFISREIYRLCHDINTCKECVSVSEKGLQALNEKLVNSLLFIGREHICESIFNAQETFSLSVCTLPNNRSIYSLYISSHACFCSCRHISFSLYQHFASPQRENMLQC